MIAKIKISGLYETMKALDKLGVDFSLEMEKVVMDTASNVAIESKRKATARGYEGASSIDVYKSKDNDVKKNEKVVFVGYDKLYKYVRFPEYGTKKQQEKSILRKTLKEHESYFHKKMDESINKVASKY